MNEQSAKIADFDKWMEDAVGRWGSIAQKVRRCAGASTEINDEHHRTIIICTKRNQYRIAACDAGISGYLGCIARSRIARPGENHLRGNDLHDGPLTFKTFQRIMFDIVAYELVPIPEPAHRAPCVEGSVCGEPSNCPPLDVPATV